MVVFLLVLFCCVGGGSECDGWFAERFGTLPFDEPHDGLVVIRFGGCDRFHGRAGTRAQEGGDSFLVSVGSRPEEGIGGTARVILQEGEEHVSLALCSGGLDTEPCLAYRVGCLMGRWRERDIWAWEFHIFHGQTALGFRFPAFLRIGLCVFLSPKNIPRPVAQAGW
jgi:hypothetical protein